MKTLVLIRTFQADDFIAWLCYQSFKAVGVDADFVFFAQLHDDFSGKDDEYNWIKQTGEKIIYRGYCCNFGGRDNVRQFIADLKQVDTTGYENIIISDSDIIIKQNPLIGFEEFDLGGIQSQYNNRHYSGQFLMYKKWLFDAVVNYDGYEQIMQEFIDDGEKGIADDSVMTHFATAITIKTKNFFDSHCWAHYKLHYLEDTFKNILINQHKSFGMTAPPEPAQPNSGCSINNSKIQ